MEKPTNNPTENNDRKEISIIIAIGVIVVVCICCLILVASYFGYNDLKTTSLFGNKTSTETINPISQPPATSLPDNINSQFEDGFDSNQNKWEEGTFEDEYGSVDFVINGQYDWDVVADKAVNQKSWAEDAPIVDDFIVSVDATHVNGAENASYGILFRVKDTNNLYYFGISDGGYYYVGLLNDGEWITLIDWTDTSYIIVNAVNNLKVKGIGDEFTFYINDTVVDRIQDSTFSEGTTGLSIELYEVGDKSKFEFDNFLLTSP